MHPFLALLGRSSNRTTPANQAINCPKLKAVFFTDLHLPSRFLSQDPNVLLRGARRGAPFCLFLERGIFNSVSYLSCGYNTLEQGGLAPISRGRDHVECIRRIPKTGKRLKHAGVKNRHCQKYQGQQSVLHGTSRSGGFLALCVRFLLLVQGIQHQTCSGKTGTCLWVVHKCHFPPARPRETST